MTILEYYISQQQYKNWYDKFQSTGNGKSGKLFAYTNTNFRYIGSFLTQIEEFKSNNGKARSLWALQSNSKQQKDKHRIVSLLNADLVEVRSECYVYTRLGHMLIDLIESDLCDKEKWFVLFLVILNYTFDEHNNHVMLATQNIISNLIECGVDEEELTLQITTLISNKKISLTEVFKTDVFWYMTFAKDNKFIRTYKVASQCEKDELHNHLILENGKKTSEDCIAHKYANGGAYTKATFLDELSVFYFTSFLLKKEYSSFETMIEELLIEYTKFSLNVDSVAIKEFIYAHKDILKAALYTTKLFKGEV